MERAVGAAKGQKPCKDTDSGFGMANVNERIRMNFGPEYGLTLDSAPGGGTIVTVRIPKEKIADVDSEEKGESS